MSGYQSAHGHYSPSIATGSACSLWVCPPAKHPPEIPGFRRCPPRAYALGLIAGGLNPAERSFPPGPKGGNSPPTDSRRTGRCDGGYFCRLRPAFFFASPCTTKRRERYASDRSSFCASFSSSANTFSGNRSPICFAFAIGSFLLLFSTAHYPGIARRVSVQAPFGGAPNHCRRVRCYGRLLTLVLRGLAGSIGTSGGGPLRELLRPSYRK